MQDSIFNEEEFKEILEEAKLNDLGARLRNRRVELGLLMSEISFATGLSMALLSNIESDNFKDIKITTAKLIATAYEVDFNVILANVNPKRQSTQVRDILEKIKTANALKREALEIK